MTNSATDKNIHASVGILTFNSGKTLQRALESVSEFTDVVLCDGGSTDDTLEIARAAGARVIPQDPAYKNPNGTLNNFGGVRQQLLDAAGEKGNDWFLYIDSDETISDGLREDIRRISSESPQEQTPLVYRVPIGIMLNGHYIKYSSNYPGYQYRFFNRKSGAHFIKPVHERIEFDTKNIPIGTLTHPWYIHTMNDDWNRYLSHTAGYRTREAKLYATRSWAYILSYVVLRGMRASLGALGKSTGKYLLHGWHSTLPLRGELSRAFAPWCLMIETIKYKIYPDTISV
jgi:glycosyltransferase involved in cell wall biosynthesis